MSNENNPNYVRFPLYNFGTKVISTDSGIEYCVEYLTEDNKQTRLLWFKEAGEYVRLNSQVNCEEENTALITWNFGSYFEVGGFNP